MWKKSKMDTKEIRSFRLVYEERSINKAAKQLFITPHGLSRIIHKLEEEKAHLERHPAVRAGNGDAVLLKKILSDTKPDRIFYVSQVIQF